MKNDINDRNYENYIDIGGKPVRRVTTVDSSGNLVNPATSEKQSDGSQKTQIVEKSPTDSTKLNPSVSITESVLGTVTTKIIQKTIGLDTYQKIVTTDSFDNSVSISAWSVV